MPSSDFSTVLVKDDRLANLTDQITYAVNKGAQQISVADFNATSQSNSSHVYNIIVPSLNKLLFVSSGYCSIIISYKFILTPNSYGCKISSSGISANCCII